MKLMNLDERIHVLDASTDVWKVVQDIANSGVQEEAFYVCDIGDIVQKHKEWQEKMPRVKPFYAVKCNDNITILEVLAALGTGFDCASKNEISKILDLGVSPERIIYANPAKPASHIRNAAAMGVNLMTFDNETELHKMKSLHPGAKLVVRIRADAAVAQCPLGMKFGCDALITAPHLIKVAHMLGLDVVGVSFHVGSGCGDPPAFRRAIAAAKYLFQFGAKLGYNFNILDIGGGFPGNKGSSLDKIAEVVNSALEEHFPNHDSVNVIAEPGRFFVASAYTLATNIHSKREVFSSEDGGQTLTHVMYYINDGVYGSFNTLLYDHATVIPIPLNVTINKIVPSSIWGPTCDGLDQVVENVLLPVMDVGDWIVFENMGAYTLPVASPFNGFPVPKVHVIADENVWFTLKDLLPITEDHFIMRSTPANLCIARDIGGHNDIQEWSLPHPMLGTSPALCHQECSALIHKENEMEHAPPTPGSYLILLKSGQSIKRMPCLKSSVNYVSVTANTE